MVHDTEEKDKNCPTWVLVESINLLRNMQNWTQIHVKVAEIVLDFGQENRHTRIILGKAKKLRVSSQQVFNVLSLQGTFMIFNIFSVGVCHKAPALRSKQHLSSMQKASPKFFTWLEHGQVEDLIELVAGKQGSNKIFSIVNHVESAQTFLILMEYWNMSDIFKSVIFMWLHSNQLGQNLRNFGRICALWLHLV